VPFKRVLDIVFVIFIAAALSPVLAQGDQTFHATSDTVAVYATVRDHDGRLVPDLTKNDFQVFDNGKPAEITTFSRDLLPITMVLMLDMRPAATLSEGGAEWNIRMDQLGTDELTVGPEHLQIVKAAEAPDPVLRVSRRFNLVREAAGRFVDALLPVDRVRIGSVGVEIGVSPLLTGDKTVLHRVINEEMWPVPTSYVPTLWAAMQVAMDTVAHESGRRVVLVLSNGGQECVPAVAATRDLVPCVSMDTVEQQAIKQDVMFYFIGLRPPGLLGSVKSLTDNTGGGHFDLARDTDLESTFERVADELHHQYAIGFRPTSLDGRTHRLEVKLARKELTAQARKSYLAAAR